MILAQNTHHPRFKPLQTTNIGPSSGQCWANVADGGPTLAQQWVNVVAAGKVLKPKQLLAASSLLY